MEDFSRHEDRMERAVLEASPAEQPRACTHIVISLLQARIRWSVFGWLRPPAVCCIRRVSF